MVSQRTLESSRLAFVLYRSLDLLLDRIDVHVLSPADRAVPRRIARAAGLASHDPRAVA
jgi:hypothetical protein